MAAYENAIEISGVTKKYSGFTLDNISFNVPKGSIMGFIGQNGAGKTTTIRSLLNIISIDEGEIKLLGLDHLRNEQEIKEQISVVFDELPFHDVLSAKDMARIFEGIYPQWDNAVYTRYLERFGLPVKKKIGEFSKGMKMKLQSRFGLFSCALFIPIIKGADKMAKDFNMSSPSEGRESSSPGDFNLYTILKSEEETFARSVEMQTATNASKETNSLSEWHDRDEYSIDSGSKEESTEFFGTIEAIGNAFISTFTKILEAIADILLEEADNNEKKRR